MDDEQKWYVVYTKPRWEKKVYRLFSEKNIEAYCPLNKVRRKWSDRTKIVEEPLFKSYVFVRASEEDKVKVRLVNGVVNFIYHEGKVAIVRDFEIDIIRKFLNEYENVQAEALNLQPDMNININSGAFMDKKATILKIVNNKVQVLIESIGYSITAFVDKSNVRIN